MSKILLIEDNETMREGMALALQKIDCEVVEVEDGTKGLACLKSDKFDLVITDFKMEGMNGLEVLKQVKQIAPHTEVIIITAYGSIDLAVEAMKEGAADFVTKPFSHQEFQIKVARTLERLKDRAELQRVTDENIYLRNELAIQFNYGEIVGNSTQMQDVYRTIQKVAPTDSSVLLYGESGTGKELVARAIHNASRRKERPFVRVNCGALAEGVLESELFGHEKGAFTGALRQKKGRFELAHKGTIFLDEAGDISQTTQLQLLRVLQEKEFERVGGEETISVDVRVIAATNKNLKQEVANGRFREDLFYRLHIIPIYLPPLRERGGDIEVLVNHFLKKLGDEINKPNLILTQESMQALKEYNWPGNVRELENLIERAAVLCEDNKITTADLPLMMKSQDNGILSQLPEGRLDLSYTLEEVEKKLIEKAMDRARGIKTEAARLLNIKTSTLYYKLEKYGLASTDLV